MSRSRLLIVDDEPDMLDGIVRLLGFERPGFDCETCSDSRGAVDLFRRVQPDIVLMDVRMPGLDGIELLKCLLREDPWLTCVMMTAHGTIELAVEAIKNGAYDFITKPFETETLARLLDKGIERSALIRENRRLRGRVEGTDFNGMIGRSGPMRRLFERIQAVARSDYSVLVRGESGTGKELAARALHAESARGRGPFVVVNCPATPEHLLESELFGHRRGAFTGAEKTMPGLFASADGGTIFLDEIADIPTTVQTKLLRVLQDGEIKPLGATRTVRTDVRVVAATNQNLEEKIGERTFREDLFYRLNVVTLTTPCLREAAEDIPLLAAHFARIAGDELGLGARRFSPEALQLLRRQGWPGNVRQLQNVVRQAVMFSRRSEVSAREVSAILPDRAGRAPEDGRGALPDAAATEPYAVAKERALEGFQRAYVEDLLRTTGGNVSQGAELSGLERASLQKIMRRLGIRSDRFRS